MVEIQQITHGFEVATRAKDGKTHIPVTSPLLPRADAKANGVKFGRKPKLTPHQKREAIKRRDKDGETLRSIGCSYNVSAATISRPTGLAVTRSGAAVTHYFLAFTAFCARVFQGLNDHCVARPERGHSDICRSLRAHAVVVLACENVVRDEQR
jgi:hypothetical protein